MWGDPGGQIDAGKKHGYDKNGSATIMFDYYNTNCDQNGRQKIGDKWLKLGCMLSTSGATNRTLDLNCSCFSEQIRDTGIVTPVADTKFCTYGTKCM